eukprot:765116-Hanusia_phi.AAC.2
MKPAVNLVMPAPHSGLGLSLYSQVPCGLQRAVELTWFAAGHLPYPPLHGPLAPSSASSCPLGDCTCIFHGSPSLPPSLRLPP